MWPLTFTGAAASVDFPSATWMPRTGSTKSLWASSASGPHVLQCLCLLAAAFAWCRVLYSWVNYIAFVVDFEKLLGFRNQAIYMHGIGGVDVSYGSAVLWGCVPYIAISGSARACIDGTRFAGSPTRFDKWAYGTCTVQLRPA